MKILNKAIIGCLLAAGLTMTSCDYLNVIPDETTTGADIAKDRQAALNYLYSCYGFLPTPNAGASSLDFLTGDEVVTAFEHEQFAAFPKGNYSASNPVISYWNTLYQGIRQCYMFQDELNKGGNFKGLEDKDRNDYKAQVTFLIGYYHFLLSRCYGPIIVVRQTPDPMLLPENYQGQEPYDDCVNFICEKFDEAAKGLPATRTGAQANEFGLATSVAAKAMKAKMLLYAASPLFNGNSEFYSNFKDKNGNALMPLTYDAAKCRGQPMHSRRLSLLLSLQAIISTTVATASSTRTAILPTRMYVLCATPSPTILQRMSVLVPTLKLSGLTHVARVTTASRTRVSHISMVATVLGTALLLL